MERLNKKVTLNSPARVRTQDCLTPKVPTFTRGCACPHKPCRAEGHRQRRGTLGGLRSGRKDGRLCAGPRLHCPAVISSWKVQGFSVGEKLTKILCSRALSYPLTRDSSWGSSSLFSPLGT